MKITLFTGNQIRHQALIKSLLAICDELYVVQECKTVFPGYVEDVSSGKSALQREYFDRVREAERKVFGTLDFIGGNQHILSIRNGDLSYFRLSELKEALESDYYIVFGASIIKNDLLNYLVERKAINIHIGVSPYYKGSACNFWALYDKRPEYVGATIHLLSDKVDDGDILYHALPAAEEYDSYEIGMRAVEAAIISLTEKIREQEIGDLICSASRYDSMEGKITRRRDFNDNTIKDYYDRLISAQEIKERLISRNMSDYVSPWILH